MVKIKSLKKEVQKEIREAGDLKKLDKIFKTYLGKRGKVTQIFRSLKKMEKKERIKIAKRANLFKKFIKKEIKGKTQKLREESRAEILEKERIDVTAPGKKVLFGHLHPLTQVQREVEEIFQSMGFSVVEGPEIETEWYNFDALNIPQDHPARDVWDTLWLKGDQRLLLRTHTSPVQVRYMEKHNPPLRIIVPGRVFRREATDASHEVNFYHVEGLMVDKDISVANFKAIIQKFFQEFFKKDYNPPTTSSRLRQVPIGIRLIPSYFPFTEPSFEVYITCLACEGKGCSACGNTGWMEMMGAGMVHPNVFKAAGLIPKEWQGFAFGIGLDRLAMMKYKINDIRLFYGGDLRFLKQF